MADSLPIPWPDLTEYGVVLGEVRTSASARALLLSDPRAEHWGVARRLGFSKTRLPGLYVHKRTELDPGALARAFPKVRIAQLARTEINARILARIREHADAQHQHALPGLGDTMDASAGEGFELPAQEAVDVSPRGIEAAPIGMNRLGETVLETPSGERLVRRANGARTSIVNETDPATADAEVASRFLRGTSLEAMALCAEGFVLAMSQGRIARAEEFTTFVRAVTGESPDSEDARIAMLAGLIDQARVRALTHAVTIDSRDAFATALSLHEAAQYYGAVREARMTPLPLALLLQEVAFSMPAGARLEVRGSDAGELDWRLAGVLERAQPLEPADVILASFDPTLLPAGEGIMGSVINRADHARVLKILEAQYDMRIAHASQASLAGEPPAQLGVFLIGADGDQGRIGPPSRHFLNALSSHYAIEGMVDLDGALTGMPGAPPMRIVVTGRRKTESSFSSLQPTVPFVSDYEQLRAWVGRTTEALRQPGSVAPAERGAVAVGEQVSHSSYQAPYIPLSLLSDPSMMVPRNLAAPTRQALLDVARRHPDVDAWVAESMAMDKAELRDIFDAEQVDSMALILSRQEQGLGFITTDMTGAGKGRNLAAAARVARLRGEPVVFLTERADLFNDFWRDIEATHSQHLFKNVLVLNDGVVVTSPTTGEIVARSAPKDELARILRSMEIPHGVEIVFATYSQFNRDPVKSMKRAGLDLATRSAITPELKAVLDEFAKQRKNQKKRVGRAVLVEAHNALADPAIIPVMPLDALKPIWLSRAVGAGLLVLDECHYASGEDSQSNRNIEASVMAARHVIYSSATFARGEKNMRLYRALFPDSVDVEGMHETLKRGGEPLQESLAAMLAMDGALIRREHDLSMLTFETVVDESRRARNIDYSDRLAEILSAITGLTRDAREHTVRLGQSKVAALVAAAQAANPTVSMDKLRAGIGSVGIASTNAVGTSIYTVMRSFITLLNADRSVEEAVRALREGKKPVIVIEHTGESELKRLLEEDLGIEDLDAASTDRIVPAKGFRALLRRMMERALEVKLDDQRIDVIAEPNFAAAVREIERFIDDFPDMPFSTLDVFRQGIEAAGFQVAELSGRKQRVNYLPDGSMLVRSIPANERRTAVERFNNGDADAILVTKAGNSGSSMHASVTYANQQQRVLIEAELAEDAVIRLQFLGRVNRKGQISHPIIKTPSTGLPAQEWQIALQNNKIRRMSANTTGNRDSANVLTGIADILNEVGNRVAFAYLELRPDLARELDINLPERNESDDDEFDLRGDKFVRQLTNRLVLRPAREQIAIRDDLMEEFVLLVEELDQKGENPLKPKFYDLRAKMGEGRPIELQLRAKTRAAAAAAAKSEAQQAVADERRASAFDRPVTIVDMEYTVHHQSMPGAAVLEAIDRGRADSARRAVKRLGEEFASLLERDPDVFFETLIDRILEQTRQRMEQSRPRNFPSVAAALASTESNIVRQINWRAEQLTAILSQLRIGSRVTYLNGITRAAETCAVVVGMKFPGADTLHYAGRYAVKIVRPGSHAIESVSLSSLMSDPYFKIHEPRPTKDTLAAFDAIKDGSYQVVRPILSGNLFRASELSMQTGQGTQGYVSDSYGIAHRAVVLPLEACLMDFSALPLRVTDPELAVQYMSSVRNATLHSTSSGRTKYEFKAGISISRNGDRVLVSMPGSGRWTNWLRAHPELLAVTGPFGGTRDRIFALMDASDLGPLVLGVCRAGISLYAHDDRFVPSTENLPKNYVERAEAIKAQKRAYVSARDWFLQQDAIEEARIVSAAGRTQDKPVDPLEQAVSGGRGRRRLTA